MGSLALASRKRECGREGLVLRPVGTACSLLVCGGHFMLMFLGTIDGQNEVSIILGGKKHTPSSLPLHTTFPVCPWQASLLIHSFIIYSIY